MLKETLLLLFEALSRKLTEVAEKNEKHLRLGSRCPGDIRNRYFPKTNLELNKVCIILLYLYLICHLPHCNLVRHVSILESAISSNNTKWKNQSFTLSITEIILLYLAKYK
jgi:hypothetical protein